MKWLLVIGAATLIGCAGTPPDPQTLARRHADNVRTAQRNGYPIVELDGRTVFCATDAPAGSHIVPPCKAEAEWERDQLWVWRGCLAWLEHGITPRSERGHVGLLGGVLLQAAERGRPPPLRAR